MDQSAAEERRKSLRVRSTPLFSSDEEDEKAEVRERKSLKKTAKPERKSRASATPTKKTTLDDSTRKYNLRSTMGDFSSEDELVLDFTKNIKTTRMSLSESRFKKQLQDIKKGKYTASPRKTSTPQKTSPVFEKTHTHSPSKVKVTKKLVFDNSAGFSVRTYPAVMTRQMQRRLEEITAEEELSVVAEADDDEPEHPTPAKKSPKGKHVKEPSDQKTEEEQCFPVTWKEFALAAFVSGVAAIGYMCYATDYCSYC